MKVGDIVKLEPRVRWLTEEEHNANGIILAVLDGGSHRKNKSYQVMWSTATDRGVIGWYVEPSLVKVETCL